MSKEFIGLRERIEELRKAHVRAYQYFYAYDKINELRAPNLVGQKKAKNNADAIGLYKGFLNPSVTALMTGFYVELAKIYDSHDDALHLNKLIDYAEANQKHLTVVDFKELNEDRPFMEELVEKYEGLKNKDLLEIRRNLDEHKDKIQRLKTIRDKHIAHLDLNRKGIKDLTYEEIEQLIILAHDILNVFSQKLDHVTSDYGVIKRQVIEDTENLVKLMGEK